MRLQNEYEYVTELHFDAHMAALYNLQQNAPKEKKDDPPPAVTEMLNILGTLRRRPRAAVNAPMTTEAPPAPRDVAL